MPVFGECDAEFKNALWHYSSEANSWNLVVPYGDGGRESNERLLVFGECDSEFRNALCHCSCQANSWTLLVLST
jgi:hypothetical protein